MKLTLIAAGSLLTAVIAAPGGPAPLGRPGGCCVADYLRRVVMRREGDPQGVDDRRDSLLRRKPVARGTYGIIRQQSMIAREVSMPTRNVVHNSHLADLVERLVASGRYQNASEGLRLVESREAEDIARLHALREAARVGIADIGGTRFRSFESPTALTHHLTAIAREAITRKPSVARSK